jgi:hypothetical protein
MSYRRSDIGTTLSARDLVAVMGARSNIGAVLAQQEQMAALSAEAERFAVPRLLPKHALLGPVTESGAPARPAPPSRRTALRRSIVAEIERLADLEARGLITRQELALMKRRLLDR